MLTLAIESSGAIGSVALFDSEQILGEKTLELGRQHGQALIPALHRLLADCDKHLLYFYTHGYTRLRESNLAGSGNQLSFQVISRTGATVDSGTIQRQVRPAP
jgi:hypothetical protein